MNNFNFNIDSISVDSNDKFDKQKVFTNLQSREYLNYIGFVDLKLPSKTLWAKYNLDANKENEHGGFYAWGETREKLSYMNYTYDYESVESKYGGNKVIKLDLEDDAAYVKNEHKDLFDQCMPSQKQLKELIDNTTCEQVFDYNGYKDCNGILLMSKINNETIFFPATGWMYGQKISNYDKINICANITSKNGYMIEMYYNLNVENIQGFDMKIPTLTYGIKEYGHPVRPVIMKFK